MKFKKRDLVLKEFKEGGESSEKQYQDKLKQASQNSDGESTTSLSDFSNNSNDDAPNIDVSASNPSTKTAVKDLANKAASIPGMKGATVTVHESVTFTKGELKEWLKTL